MENDDSKRGCIGRSEALMQGRLIDMTQTGLAQGLAVPSTISAGLWSKLNDVPDEMEPMTEESLKILIANGFKENVRAIESGQRAFPDGDEDDIYKLPFAIKKTWFMRRGVNIFYKKFEELVQIKAHLNIEADRPCLIFKLIDEA